MYLLVRKPDMLESIHKTKSGFTLIELILVILVLGICIAPIAILFYNVTVKYSKSEVIQIATVLAEDKMERVRSLRFSSVTDESGVFTGDFSNYAYEVIVERIPTSLADDPGENEYKQVEVKVTNQGIEGVSLKSIVTIKQNVWP